MAIYHLSVKIIGRDSGRSAVGASAYRSGKPVTIGKLAEALKVDASELVVI